MKSISWSVVAPYFFVEVNDKTALVPSMVLSTLFACVLLTYLPQFAVEFMKPVKTKI